MSTVFFAVQCCQCSTMQVKQWKKNSNNNKWTCVVCNQKQSARKVFGESSMAKDLRPLVQSFNMSRQFTQQNPQEHQQHHQTLVPDDIPINAHKKRPTDWTQYLDSEDDQRTKMMREDDESGGFEPQIVTELPPDLFKKPKLNRYNATGSVDSEEGGVFELHGRRQVFPKKKSSKEVVSPDDVEGRRSALTVTPNTSKWSHLVMQGDPKSRTLQPTKATLTGASKWNDYVTEDDNDDLRLINRRSSAHNAVHATVANYEYRTQTTDERVEDDIHPDFLHG